MLKKALSPRKSGWVCEKERETEEVGREQAGEVPFMSGNLLSRHTLPCFMGSFRCRFPFYFSSFTVALISGNLKAAWMDLSVKRRCFAKSDKTCPPACSLISLGSMSFSCLGGDFWWWSFSLPHGVGPARYFSWDGASKALELCTTGLHLLQGLMATHLLHWQTGWWGFREGWDCF